LFQKGIDKELEERRYRWLYETRVVIEGGDVGGRLNWVILKEGGSTVETVSFIVSNDISMGGV